MTGTEPRRMIRAIRMIRRLHPQQTQRDSASTVRASAEEGETNSERPLPSLKLEQVLDVFQIGERATPKQLARLLGIATDTACCRF
jgi:hypothetical protein